MGQIISKRSKRKHGLTPGYMPRFYKEPTEQAIIPLCQKDGSIKYITLDDLKWMVDNGHIDATAVAREENPPSQE